MLLICGFGGLLRISWTARRSNQSILKEISPEYSLEGLMLKLQYLATQCKELTHWKRPWCWERLKAGREGDDRGWDVWMASLTWVWASSGSWWWTGKPGMLQSRGSQRVGHKWATELRIWYPHYKQYTRWLRQCVLWGNQRQRWRNQSAPSEWGPSQTAEAKISLYLFIWLPSTHGKWY